MKVSNLGTALSRYISDTSSCYDPVFVNKIRTIRADWLLIAQSDIADEKKKQILKMAKNGEPKLSRGHPLYRSFHNYIYGGCYDPVFHKEAKDPIFFIAKKWEKKASKLYFKKMKI